MRIALGLLVFASLFGCTCRKAVVPDLRIPHQVAEEACVKVLVRKAGEPPSKWSKECVRVGPGWWIASDVLIGSAP